MTRTEQHIDDIMRGGLIIEIHTRGFSAIKNNLERLADSHTVRLVYPVARET